MVVSKQLTENIRMAKEIFPIGKSFDLITRDLYLGSSKAYLIGINGFCDNEVLQEIFAELQNPHNHFEHKIKDIENYMNSKIGYIQTSLTSRFYSHNQNVLSGVCVLFIDEFDSSILIDTRTYPVRTPEEPDTEKVTRGSKTGFVESILSNTIMIRRNLRTPKLIFEIASIGDTSQTDVAITYIDGMIDTSLLDTLRNTIKNLKVTTLTLGVRSMEELLIHKHWYNLLPSLFLTERPDVLCSYLSEGHIALVVDNSPAVIILPCTIFQFTQAPEDYYKSPAVGNYLRAVRFLCLFISLFLMPLFLLFGAFVPIPSGWPIVANSVAPAKLFSFVLLTELGLDLFNYSCSHTSSRFSNSLSIIGGLVISQVAIDLNWTSLESIFYGAITMLTTLSIASIEFGEAVRLYRLFLILMIGLFKLPGFIIGVILVLFSIVTTPTFAKKSYFWPLFPFNWQALKKLLFRYPTTKAQPINSDRKS